MLDVVHAAKQALEFTLGMTAESFLADVKTQSAVLHQLTVLGEAVRRVSGTYREAHPSIPWKEMAGLRSRIVHDYDEVDLDEVWQIIEKDLRTLVQQLDAIARQEPR